MRKNLIVFMLSLAMASSLLAGCSSDSGETKPIVKEDGNSESKTDETEAQTQAQAQTAAPAVEVTIEEQTLVDQDGIVITATEYVNDDWLGDGIKLLLENNSDKDVMVGCNALIVNNYMITDLFASEIAAGKKANETMYLSSSELKAAGIENVGQVEIYFHVFDNTSYDTIFDSKQVVIKTSAYDSMDTSVEESGTELYNKNGVKILGKAVDENSFWGKAILLYVENESNKNVTVSCDNLSVNGFMLDPVFSSNVYSGKKAFDEITLMSTDLEQNGIESIEEVELKFHIFDSNTFDTIDDSEAISFSTK